KCSNLRFTFKKDWFKIMQIINPATEEVIATLQPDNKETVSQKFESAKTAQRNWKHISLPNRIATLVNFSALLEKNRESLAHTLSSEMGKPVQQARNEINGARGRIQFFLDHSEKWLSDEWLLQDPGMSEKIAFEPLGVITNISAWNYPYLVGVNV